MSEEKISPEENANTEDNNNSQQTTKKCPFCAELILVDAVKCRHCGEFLDGSRRNATPLNRPRVEHVDSDTGDYHFVTGPSLLAGLFTYFKSIVIIAVAIAVMFIPLSENSGDTPEQASTIPLVRNIVCGVIMAFGILLSVLRIAQLRATVYEINPDRIEWARGIFNRKMDNTDLFRIVDIKLHRSILDCMFGIGTITIMTQDKTDPEFEILKVRSPKKIYHALKNSYLEADRKQGVIHVD